MVMDIQNCGVTSHSHHSRLPTHPPWLQLLGKQSGTTASGLQYRDSLRVEGHKLFSTQPVTFIRNDTVREISACIEDGQAGLDRWLIG
jgi:hypothetical protein